MVKFLNSEEARGEEQAQEYAALVEAYQVLQARAAADEELMRQYALQLAMAQREILMLRGIPPQSPLEKGGVPNPCREYSASPSLNGRGEGEIGG